MAIPFTADVAAAYDALVTAKGNRPENQWSENAFLNKLETMGAVKRIPGGPYLDIPLDYQNDGDAEFMASDTTATSTTKSDFLTQAQYVWANLTSAINWSFAEEAENSSENKKVSYVTALIENGLAKHDDVIETGLFAASATNGFMSLPTLATEDGTGTVGSIVAGTETWWKNQFTDYGDATALLAYLSTLYTSCAKGSGGSAPNLVITSAASHGVYEGKLVANQRFNDTSSADGGFAALKFHAIDVIFSQKYTSDSYWMINTNNTKLYVTSGAYRRRGQPVEHINAAMNNMKIYSRLQFATGNRSRIGVAFT